MESNNYKELGVETKACPKNGICEPHPSHTYIAPNTEAGLVWCPGFVVNRRVRR